MDTVTARAFYAAQAARVTGRHDARVEAAFNAVPREDFLGPGPWRVSLARQTFTTPGDDPALIYQNCLVVLAADEGINNGEPFLHAQLLAALALPLGARVTHIGCGTGYYTAILAELVGGSGHVTGVERHPRLAALARAALADRTNVTVLEASGTEICPAADAIYINAGATRPLALWLDVLAEGGRLLFPLTGTDGWGVMLRVGRTQGLFPADVVCRVGFVGLHGARDPEEAAAITAAVRRARQERPINWLVRNDRPDASAVLVGRDWWLSNNAQHP